MIFSDFMVKLRERFVEERNLKPISADIYLRNLHRLNGGPFNNLGWIKDRSKIENYIAGLKTDANRMNYYKALAMVLKLYSNSKKYKSDAEYYGGKLSELAGKRHDFEKTHEPTEKMKKSWMSWEDLHKKKYALLDKIEKQIKGGNKVDMWDNLLKYFVASLYIDQEPRRNEYMNMKIVKKGGDAKDPSLNYIALDDEKFIFNNYKTARKYGQQIIDYSGDEDLKSALKLYMKYHPGGDWLLVKYNGERLTGANAITNILNSVFGRGVAATMIRHIYLSEKYGSIAEEMSRDAEQMAHSGSMQFSYIKNFAKEKE